MKRTKIAPKLASMFAVPLSDVPARVLLFDGMDMRREFRALVAVARAAERLNANRSWAESGIQPALDRLRRASGRKP